jgi:hypothetical protein
MTTDEVSFGFEDFWPIAHQAFPKFWEIMPRLVDSMNSLLARGYASVDPIHKVTINLGILAATSLTETMTLVGNGLGHGAMKIARAMLECAINAEYLRRFPAELDDYMDWSKVENHKLLAYIKSDAPHLLTKFPQAYFHEVERDFLAVRSRFEFLTGKGKKKLRGSWCSVALDVRASKTEFHEAYRLIYPLGSKLTHATIGGMAMHADRHASSARVGVPPSLMLCREALIPTHLCAVKIVETVSNVMAQQPSHSVASLAADYHYAWGTPAQP